MEIRKVQISVLDLSTKVKKIAFTNLPLEFPKKTGTGIAKVLSSIWNQNPQFWNPGETYELNLKLDLSSAYLRSTQYIPIKIGTWPFLLEAEVVLDWQNSNQLAGIKLPGLQKKSTFSNTCL
jgi:hypothetical protein